MLSWGRHWALLPNVSLNGNFQINLKDLRMEVRIYRPSKSTMQSGRAKVENWVLEYELKTPRRPENIMGWTSSGDTLNQVKLTFPSMEDAVAYATKKGWGYTVQPAHDRVVRPRNYVDNFKYIPAEDSQKA
jgi:hypothetical protein